MPMMTERGLGGTSAASLRHGARPRAAPSPAASSASRKPSTTACSSDGAAAGVRQASATAAVNSAYGQAIASAA